MQNKIRNNDKTLETFKKEKEKEMIELNGGDRKSMTRQSFLFRYVHKTFVEWQIKVGRFAVFGEK